MVTGAVTQGGRLHDEGLAEARLPHRRLPLHLEERAVRWRKRRKDLEADRRRVREEEKRRGKEKKIRGRERHTFLVSLKEVWSGDAGERRLMVANCTSLSSGTHTRSRWSSTRARSSSGPDEEGEDEDEEGVEGEEDEESEDEDEVKKAEEVEEVEVVTWRTREPQSREEEVLNRGSTVSTVEALPFNRVGRLCSTSVKGCWTSATTTGLALADEVEVSRNWRRRAGAVA